MHEKNGGLRTVPVGDGAMDGTQAFDAQGNRIYSWVRMPEVAAAMESCGASQQNLFRQAWLPHEHIMDMQQGLSPGPWIVPLVADGQVAMVATVHRIGLRTSPVSDTFVVHYDWCARRDETLRTLRMHVLQMARLACVGSLGGAIAHALNNPLATIRGFAEVIKRRFGDVERIGYFADKIITNSDRMRGTIDELRAISKPQHRDGAHGRVDLKDVLESTLGIMDEQCKMHNIDVQCDLKPELPAIRGESTQWQALFLSLLAHSRDAFKELPAEQKRKVVVSCEMTAEGLCLRYHDTSGAFPCFDGGLPLDPVDVLMTLDSAKALPVFVALEVLSSSQVNLQVEVEPGQSTDLIMTVGAQAFCLDSPEDSAWDQAC